VEKKAEKKTKPAAASKNTRKSALTEKKIDKNIPGSALIAKLWEKMLKDNISPHDLATQHLDISYSYLMLLGRGEAPVNQLAIPKYLRMAAYLGIPLMQVMLLAEAVAPEDFFYNAGLEDRIALVYEKMKKDPVYMGFAPNEHEWDSLSLKMKLSFCVMYENSSQTKFLNVAELIQVVAPT